MITHCPNCEGEVTERKYGLVMDIDSFAKGQQTANTIKMTLYLCRDCDWIQVKEITRNREWARGLRRALR